MATAGIAVALICAFKLGKGCNENDGDRDENTDAYDAEEPVRRHTLRIIVGGGVSSSLQGVSLHKFLRRRSLRGQLWRDSCACRGVCWTLW